MYSARKVKGLYFGMVLAVALGVSMMGQGIVVNEVAWMGTAAHSVDEWIELYNPTDETIDLDGWTLTFGNTIIHLGRVEEATVEVRRSVIEPNGFFLLERTDDGCIGDIEADVIYRGSLSNQGISLHLLDSTGVTVDTANLEGAAWPAGTAADGTLPYASMERISPIVGDQAENWGENDGIIRCGKDANDEPINGTPGMKNAMTTAWETHPRTTFIAPQAEMTLTGTVEIAWSAVDPDGTTEGLQIDLHLSMDEGETWESLALGLANGGVYQWDSWGYPDGHYRLKITATDQDGHIGETMSSLFSIANTD